MAISLNNSVSNGTGTPAAITGVIANIPAATSVADGTIYISTDTQEIFTAQAGSWINVSGGGGGSQNLDQVLAVGDTGTNKNITLSGSTGSQVTLIRPGFSSANMVPQGFSSGLSTGGLLSNVLLYNQPSPNIVRLWIQSFALPQVINTEAELDYQADNNGKNQFFIRKLNGSANDFRRFVVNASYSGGNTVEIADENTSADTLASVECLAENQTAYIWIKSTSFLSLNVFDQLFLRPTDFVFTNTSGASIQVYPSFPASGTNTVDLPQFSGVMANVNERIVDNNVDLSAGNYPCAVYGVYVVNVGDNTNTFDLDTFVSNGVDGQFVTICAANTPVKCTNTAGNFYGTANINSLGLYKLMKVGNDIYSSHL
jgi:hypothetical protein